MLTFDIESSLAPLINLTTTSTLLIYKKSFIQSSDTKLIHHLINVSNGQKRWNSASWIWKENLLALNRFSVQQQTSQCELIASLIIFILLYWNCFYKNIQWGKTFSIIDFEFFLWAQTQNLRSSQLLQRCYELVAAACNSINDVFFAWKFALAPEWQAKLVFARLMNFWWL